MNIHIKKIIIIITSFIACSFLLEYFLIIPTIRDMKEISIEIQKEKEALEKKFQKGQLADKVNEEFKKIEPRQKEIEMMFIVPGDELALITQFEKIAQKYNLEPEFTKIQENTKMNVKNKETTSQKKLKKMPIETHLNGDFIQTMKYIADIETLKYYYNISSISINSNDIDGKTFTKIIGNAFLLN